MDPTNGSQVLDRDQPAGHVEFKVRVVDSPERVWVRLVPVPQSRGTVKKLVSF